MRTSTYVVTVTHSNEGTVLSDYSSIWTSENVNSNTIEDVLTTYFSLILHTFWYSLTSFISNDLFKRLVGKFPVFWAVAYFFLKILDSRCLFYIVNFEKLHHFYRYFCNTWIFIFEASINNILRLKKGIIVGTNTKYCHYSFILDFIFLKCCLKFSAKN